MINGALSQYTNLAKEDVDNALDILELFLRDILVESKIPSSYTIEKSYGVQPSTFYRYRSGENKLTMMRLKEIESLRDHVWQNSQEK